MEFKGIMNYPLLNLGLSQTFFNEDKVEPMSHIHKVWKLYLLSMIKLTWLPARRDKNYILRILSGVIDFS